MELVYTNDKCIGCNKCIRACYCEGACIAVEQDGIQSIHVDPAKCIGCGACIDACQHNARAFYDDTERFFAICKEENLFHCWLLLLLERIIWTNMKKS